MQDRRISSSDVPGDILAQPCVWCAAGAEEIIAVHRWPHDIPRVPPRGPIWVRFPEPIPLSTPLVKDLYWYCGAGLIHIELLTGQPAETVRRFMGRDGIPLRHPGGRTPFLRRWRTGQGRAKEGGP